MRILLTPEDVPQPEAGQTTIQYGLALFGWLVTHGAYGLLSVEQLELAKHASVYAVTSPDLLDSTREQLQAVRTLLASIIARLSVPAPAAEPLGHPARSGPLPSSPVPIHPAPRPLAPVGSTADRHDLDVGF